jgi:hypothetical protein
MDNSFFEFDPSSFDYSKFRSILGNLRNGQRAVISPMKMGNSTALVFGVEPEKVEVDLSTLIPNYDLVKNSTPIIWEYMYKLGSQETQLNELGKDGWELCAVTSRPDGELWIFKRIKPKAGG